MKFVTTVLIGSFLAAPAFAQYGRPMIDQAVLDSTAQALSLTDVQKRSEDRHVPDLQGRLPGGAMIEVDFNRDGSVEEIEARNSGLAPVSEVSAVLPEALLNADRFPADGRFEKIELDKDGFEFEGQDASGNWVEAEYGPDGQLRDWETE
ncbi:hypothetical protein [Paracoccus aerodenitrificans]|uniref:hypothetical protein n=1 Tax=Paracoccus aerodenitrificans TaxID=3017781 RepID=UPI0022F023FB|nr:hypothetical protein [Paracoccus aerodenitrificans]WBU63760.1 hypothetical protein PAE61_15700 [Paracoccus aerodenitrificans]